MCISARGLDPCFRQPLATSLPFVLKVQHKLDAAIGMTPADGYVDSWIETRRYQSEKANLTVLFDKYVPPYLEQLRTRFKTLTPIPENSMVQVCIRNKTAYILRNRISETSTEHVVLCRNTLLDCLLTPENVSMDCPRELYEMYFVFACIWAFGRVLSQDQVS
ncbi:hypothetical protein QYF61_011129 [Mycteria americana]|uniref:Dynein heavy chain AAA 5 extension domain-containing protein n=1 Tax=Mycteria americana TaxID=33587 RepID=A0AAN7PQC9_MYCAM|nr:hypothetical protein QYF61_011129 [Mycteria americana]